MLGFQKFSTQQVGVGEGAEGGEGVGRAILSPQMKVSSSFYLT